MTSSEIKKYERMTPQLCGCDLLVKTRLLSTMNVVFSEVLLDGSIPVSPDNVTFESVMFGLQLVLISPTKVELLDANSRLIKVAEKGLPGLTYNISAHDAVRNIKVNTGGFVSEYSIVVKQTSLTQSNKDIPLLAVKQARFDSPPVVAGQGRHPFETIVVFVGLEANFEGQTVGGFVLIR